MTDAVHPHASRWIGRRVLFRVGATDVHSYKVALYVGCVAGVYAGAAVAAERGLDATRFALVTIGLLIPAFVGSRLWFVVRQPAGFRGDAGRVARRSDGGSALFGGLALSIALSAPVLRAAGLPFWRFWDAASVTMLVGLVLTRLGCLMNGCCAGRATGRGWAMWLPNVAGEWRRRHPTQLLEAGYGVLVLAVVLATRHGLPFDGAVFVGVIGSYCAGRAFLQTLREATL